MTGDIDRAKKIDSLNLLISNSKILSESTKTKLIKMIPSLSTETIVSLGKFLAFEHRNRSVLDKILLKALLQYLKQDTKE